MILFYVSVTLYLFSDKLDNLISFIYYYQPTQLIFCHLNLTDSKIFIINCLLSLSAWYARIQRKLDRRKLQWSRIHAIYDFRSWTWNASHKWIEARRHGDSRGRTSRRNSQRTGETRAREEKRGNLLFSIQGFGADSVCPAFRFAARALICCHSACDLRS